MTADKDHDDDDESVDEAEQLSQTNVRVPVIGTNNGFAAGWTFHRSGTDMGTGKLFIDRVWVRVRVTFSETQWAGTGAGTWRMLVGGHGHGHGHGYTF